MKTNTMRWGALVCLVACCALARAETGVTNIINGVTTNFSSAYIVGTNGAFNALIVTNGGVVKVTGDGVIANSAISSNNYALVTGPGSVWSNSGWFYVGDVGSWNQLIVNNGGQVVSGQGRIGNTTGAVNNSVLVSGTGSLWKINDVMYVGMNGSNSSMTIADGGSVWAWNATIGENSVWCSVFVTGTGSVWAVSGNVVVGSDSSHNSLTISNGGQVTSGWTAMGLVIESSNNSAVVTGAGSLWRINDRGLHVGYDGSSNSLLISNGGQVTSTTNLYIGDSIVSSNNSVFVTGGDSLWSNSLDIYVGVSGSGNGLTIANSGRVVNRSGFIGTNVSASNNSVVVTGLGSLWSNSGNLNVGYGGFSNRLTIANNGRVVNSIGCIGCDSRASNNSVLISGSGSVWSNTNWLDVGASGSFNNLTITDGGQVFNTVGCIGRNSPATNNAVTVSGSSSLWQNSENLYVGSNGPGSMLTVADSGTILASNVFLGFTATSTGNLVTVSGGNLYATNTDANGSLDIRRGTLTLNSGTVTVDQLIVTNGASSVFKFNGGTLNSGSSTVSNGTVFTVGDTGTGATLNLLGGSHLFANGVTVGNVGSANNLRITNGTVAQVTGTSIIGNTSISSNNALVVSSSGSRWVSRGDLYVGSAGNGNRLIINNGGVVSNLNASIGNYMAVGFQYNNTVLVDGPGSTWFINGTVYVSRRGTGNGLTIRNGGRVTVANDFQIGTEAEGDNNFLTVDGAGTVLSIGADFGVGGFGSGNILLITNGATVYSGHGHVGAQGGGNGNSAIVTGSGSLWSNNFMQVGRLGSGNSLTIADNGTVTAGTLLVGSNSPASGNLITVTGGNLYVTNAGATGLLDVRRGSLNLNSGTVTVNQLHVTNGANSAFTFNSGTLASAGSTMSNAAQFRVGDGTTAATLHLDGGTHSFANGLFINTNASLTGTGAVFGVITNAGTIAPGDSAGIITDTGSLTLLGTTLLLMELAGVDPSFYDQFNISGAFNFGGALTVSLLGGFTPVAGDRFDLFDFSSSSGVFSQTNLPGLGAGLSWDTSSLYSIGEIAVVAPGKIMSPTNGSVLTSSTVTISWAALAGASQYALWVGSASNSYDLYARGVAGLSQVVTGLPADSRKLYVTLWAFVGGAWLKADTATYTAATPVKAAMTTPTNGTTFVSSSVTFNWNPGAGVALCVLWIGNNPFSYDLYAGVEYGSSRTVTLPTDGRTIHVTLLSYINGAWQWNTYAYTAYTSPIAVMVSPTPASTLTGDRVNFEWATVPGATYYALWVGTTLGGNNLYAGVETGQSRTVSVWTNGSTIYVRLFTYVNGLWRWNDYTYTAYNKVGTEKAEMLSPAGGTTLNGDRANFQWKSGVGATYIALWVGTTLGGNNLYAGVEYGLSRIVTVPTNGGTIYVRLFSFISGAWQWNDYTYTACNKVGTEKAAMQSPTAGSTLTGAVTRFSWSSGIGVSYTAFWVGTTQGGYDLYAGVEYGLSRILTLPTNGQTIYVTLWSYVNGAWQSNAYTYTSSGP